MRIDLDLETTGTDWKNDEIILNGYRVDFGDIRYAPCGSIDPYLFDLLSDSRNELWGHSIRFDALFLTKAGYKINCDLVDTKVMAYCTWPELLDHGLKSLCDIKLGNRYLETLNDICFKPLKDDQMYLEDYQECYYKLMGKWGRKDKIHFYHREDVYNIERLTNAMTPPQWFFDVEVPLTKILFQMELLGIQLDLPKLEGIKNDIRNGLETLRIKLGQDFNPDSKDQLIERLKGLGIDLNKNTERTPGGDYKIDKVWLRRQAWKGSEFCKDILEHRALNKVLNTYAEPFSQVEDGRLRGSINQAGAQASEGEGTGTKTGRLTSSNPNLQNIPSRTKLGKTIRECFIPSQGYNLYDSDLPQIEPRLIGHYSQSRKLIDAYTLGLDTHGLFAADVFGPSFTPTQRFIGKSGWLATAYGCSPQKLLFICENYSDVPLDIDFKRYEGRFNLLPKVSKYGWNQKKLRDLYWDEAEVIYSKWEFFREFQEKFIAANPEIWGWRSAAIARARGTGYVRTIGGRVIKIEGLDSKNNWNRSSAERKAINYLIQGSAADIFKQLTLGFNGLLQEKDGRFLAFIHDEWLLESNKDIYKEEWQAVVDRTVQLRNIPLPLEISKIDNWAGKK